MTHFHPTRDELLRAITAHLTSQYDEQLAALCRIEDPRAGAQTVLKWLLPYTEADRGIARRRILMSAEAQFEEPVRDYLMEMDRKERAALRTHLARLVPSGRVESYIDLLRTTINGITLAIVDRPEEWPAERQIGTLNLALEAIGLRLLDE